MKRKHIYSMLIITAILIFAGAGIGLTHDGWGGRGGMMGYGGHMMGNGGHMMDYGDHMRGYGGHMMGPGYGPGYGDMSKEDYNKLEKYTYDLFELGSYMAAQQGLILVDTKYEFGIRDGKIMLIDEIHTPDSSRTKT